jgi:DNA uptake protein ComE-like DNA-binding protein
LITPPDSRQEEAPVWVQEEALQDSELEASLPVEPALSEEAGIESNQAEQAAAELEPELPAWLAEVETEQASEPADWQPPAESVMDEVGQEPAPEPQLDLNTASLIELENLPGVGFRLAQSIIDRRREVGPFSDLQDLVELGADPGLVESLNTYLKVSQKPVEMVPSFQYAAEFTGPEYSLLSAARGALVRSEIDESLDQYSALIKSEQLLDEVIRDLQDALYQHQTDLRVWQALGDAYLRKNQFQEAMEAYTRAEELLR